MPFGVDAETPLSASSAPLVSFSARSVAVAMIARRAFSLPVYAVCVERARKAKSPGSAASFTSERACAATSAAVAPVRTTSSLSSARTRYAAFAGPSYSSSAMWKFEPPKPNELTDARRGWFAGRAHGRARVVTWKGLLSSASFGFGCSTLIVGGSVFAWSASTAFTRPAAPAAAFVWPICDFTEPI